MNVGYAERAQDARKTHAARTRARTPRELATIAEVGDRHREFRARAALDRLADAEPARAVPGVAARPLDDLVDHHVERQRHRRARIDRDFRRDSERREIVDFRDGAGSG